MWTKMSLRSDAPTARAAVTKSISLIDNTNPSDEARLPLPAQEAYDKYHIQEVGAEHGDQEYDREERREGHHHLGEAHEDVVPAPAEVSRCHADQETDYGGNKGRYGPDGQRDSGRENYPGEYVAASRVRAEDVFQAGTLVDAMKVDAEVVLPGDERGEYGHEREQYQQRQPQECHPVARELPQPRLSGTAFLYFKL